MDQPKNSPRPDELHRKLYTDDVYCEQVNCSQIREQLVIRVNGDVVLCCHDWFGHYKLANLYDTGISEEILLDLFNSKEMYSVRDALKYKRSIVPSLCISCKRLQGGEEQLSHRYNREDEVCTLMCMLIIAFITLLLYFVSKSVVIPSLNGGS